MNIEAMATLCGQRVGQFIDNAMDRASKVGDTGTGTVLFYIENTTLLIACRDYYELCTGRKAY